MTPDIENPASYRAALYIRLSKEDEREGPSQSVMNQRSLLMAFVQQQGLAVFDTYVDDGWSGTSFARPAFQRMLADIEKGRVNLVITKDLSRLGRDYIQTGHYMERYFPEKRVRYISLLDGIDTGVESTANDITPFRAIMNDMYAKDISKKIKSVKRDKQRKGLFIGGKPAYGYQKHPTQPNRIITDEKAAAVVRRIFALAQAGTSCRQIARTLNEAQLPPPAVYCGWAGAGQWSGECVSRMLQNEVYLGTMVQGRTVKVSYKSKKCLRQARENWAVVAHTHAPIVTREAFEQVQQLLASRRATRSRTYDFLLKGLIFCHECGHPLGVTNRPTASGTQRLFFMCRTYQRFPGQGACTCHAIKEQTVTDAVLQCVAEVCRPFLCVERLLPLACHALAVERDAAARDRAVRQMQAQLAQLAAHMEQAYLDYLNGLLAAADFARISSRMQQERATLEERIKALQAKENAPSLEERAQLLVQHYLDGAWLERPALVSLLERVELTQEKELLVRFRFSAPQCLS